MTNDSNKLWRVVPRPGQTFGLQSRWIGLGTLVPADGLDLTVGKKPVTARTRLVGVVSKGGTLRSAGISIAWGVAGRLRVGGIAWRPRSIPLCDGDAPPAMGKSAYECLTRGDPQPTDRRHEPGPWGP
jgi:hypothetical protein